MTSLRNRLQTPEAAGSLSDPTPQSVQGDPSQVSPWRSCGDELEEQRPADRAEQRKQELELAEWRAKRACRGRGSEPSTAPDLTRPIIAGPQEPDPSAEGFTYAQLDRQALQAKRRDPDPAPEPLLYVTINISRGPDGQNLQGGWAPPTHPHSLNPGGVIGAMGQGASATTG
ncbi:unnamed protein product [Lepidochelys olivacea]